jgi:UDP-glucose 4-epimerase
LEGTPVRVLVTGGAGFIGSHVVDGLVEQGHDVIALDDLSSGKRSNVHSQARLVIMDIRDPRVRGLFSEERPEVIVHHAAQINVRTSVTDPHLDADINILGTINVLEAAAAAGARRFIFASTGGAIYGEQERFPADENHPTRPISPYGMSKLAAETYIGFFSRTRGLQTVVLRYANVYGPRQDPHGEAGVVAIFATAMRQGRSPTIFGDGEQTRDFVHVQDVARANISALAAPSGETFNIGTGVETSVNTVYAIIAEHLGFDGKPVYAEPREGDLRRSCLSVRHAEEVLGWRPQVSLKEGLCATASALVNTGGAA